MAPVPASLRATLLAATAVEAYAGAALVLAPARFVRATYGVRGAVDPLTLKFARCVALRERCRAPAPANSCVRVRHSTAGIALGCLGVLAGLCVASEDAPPAVVATLALYNVAAVLNNAGQAGGALATVVHIALSAGFLPHAVNAYLL